jgi:Core-2/I-Branching enzyme
MLGGFPAECKFSAVLVALAAAVASTDAVPVQGTDAACSLACLGPPHTASDTTARIFYFVSVHNERTMIDAVHLLRAIRDPRNRVLVHVDLKAADLMQPDNPLQLEIEQCPCHDTVRVASKFDVQWSHWSMNLPTLWALQGAVTDYAGEWDVWINVSGDTLPVYNVNTLQP